MSPGRQHRPRREHDVPPAALSWGLDPHLDRREPAAGGRWPGQAGASLSSSPALDGWPGDSWASALLFPFLPPEDQLPPGFPNIDMGPQLKVVERTRTATMLCAASGNPDPEITWFKDFLPVDPSASNGRIKQLRSGEHRRPAGCGSRSGQRGEGGSSPAQGPGTHGQEGGGEGLPRRSRAVGKEPSRLDQRGVTGQAGGRRGAAADGRRGSLSGLALGQLCVMAGSCGSPRGAVSPGPPCGLPARCR